MSPRLSTRCLAATPRCNPSNRRFSKTSTRDGYLGHFDITVNYTGDPAYASFFTAAARRWEQVIRADLPDVNSAQYGLIDDLRIEANVSFIDGVNGILGQAGPDLFRSGSSLPYHGVMTFNSADVATMANNGTLFSVILHEMGHVLGIGTLWNTLGLRSGSQYIGANAVNAYHQVGGSGSSVPLETTGGSGTALVHWSEAVFDNELMTGFAENPGVSMPLSIVTIGSLQDMGYKVDYAAADPYRLPGHLVAGAESPSMQADAGQSASAFGSEGPAGLDGVFEPPVLANDEVGHGSSGTSDAPDELHGVRVRDAGRRKRGRRRGHAVVRSGVPDQAGRLRFLPAQCRLIADCRNLGLPSFGRLFEVVKGAAAYRRVNRT